MPGPNSAPNKERRLTSDEVVCARHGEQDSRCDEKCNYVRYRTWLADRNRLHTGKTALTRGR